MNKGDLVKKLWKRGLSRGRFLNQITTIYQKPYTVVLAAAAEDEEVLEGKKTSRVAGAAAARTRALALFQKGAENPTSKSQQNKWPDLPDPAVP
jgi:hypothetical protein